MNLTESYFFLRKRLGSQEEAAKYLGMTPPHYSALRSGRAPMPLQTKLHITRSAELLKARELEATPEPQPGQGAEE